MTGFFSDQHQIVVPRYYCRKSSGPIRVGSFDSREPRLDVLMARF